MNSKDLLTQIGKSNDSPEIEQLLSQLGYNKKLRPPRDTTDLAVNIPKQGICLFFVPKDTKSSRLTLMQVQLYSDLEKGYTTFSGDPPSRLAFSDTRQDVVRKLGEPIESNEEYRSDEWELSIGDQKAFLVVQYAKDRPGICMIHFGLPY